MSAANEPVPFEPFEGGAYLHGTKADLAVGDLLVPGRESNFEQGRLMNFVYFTATLDAAAWGAELAAGERRGRIYVVEPTGDFETTPMSPTRGSQGIRRCRFAAASRFVSWARSATGSVTHRRSYMPCGTDSMR